MRVTTLEKDEDVTKLAQRLFSTRSKAAQQQAEELLVKANPHLADPKRATPGSVIVVPDVPDLQPSGGPQGPQDLAVTLLTKMRDRLGNAAEELAPSLQRQEDEANQTLEQLKSADIKKLAKDTPEAAPHLDALSKNAKERADRAKTLRKLQDEGLEKLKGDLDDMLVRLGGPAVAGGAGKRGAKGG